MDMDNYNKAIELLDKYGYIFGSHAFGVETEKSDVDYFMYENNFKEIQDDLVELSMEVKKLNYAYRQFKKGVQYKFRNGKHIHVVPLKLREIHTWRKVINMMDCLSKIDMRSKPYRIKIFEGLLKLLA